MVLDAPPATPTSPYDKVFQANAIKLPAPTQPANTSTAPPAPTEDWLTADAIIKKLIYHTISEPLLERVLKAKPKTSRDAWEILEKIFTDNKRSKIVELVGELRGLDIGDLTVDAYFHKIDAIASRLSNLGSNVTDEDLVTYAINGLSEKYDQVAHIMLTREPFLDLETVRSMVTMVESRINRKNNTLSSSRISSSSPTALLTQGSTSKPPGNNSRSNSICRNFAHGFCMYADRCKFVHDNNNRIPNNSFHGSVAWGSPNNRIHNASATFSSRGTSGNNTGSHSHTGGLGQGQLLNAYSQLLQAHQTLLAQAQQAQQRNNNNRGSAGTRTKTSNVGQAQQSLGQQLQAHVGSSSTNDSAQETALPQAFSTLTLQDFGNEGWNMDTGATLHLNSNANNLSSIFNKRMYPSVFVGNDASIPVTNTCHSTLPTPFRPLHLNNVLITPNIVKNLIVVRKFTRDNKCSIEFDEFGFSVKDYSTRQILIRCDSAGDLYPVTKPTTYPQAFITSQHTWHQRLGHPGSEVLRSLISSNSILCNKMKSSVLCHACQLGKHVKLPFASSDSIVHSPFDIVHSDLWTSPVPSISGIKYYVLFLDHFSHYIWVYPLRYKSDTFSKFAQFRSFIKTQFKVEIKAFQCDHGVIISRHVTFDETVFPYGSVTPNSAPSYTFLDDDEPTIRPSSSTNTVEPTITEPIQPTPIEPDSTEPTTNISPESPTHVVAAPILAEAHQIPSTTTPQNPTSTYSMVTRSRAGVTKPNPKYHCHVSTISPIPKSYNAAFTDPNWQSAMLDEYNALVKNRTWTLVPRPPNTNIVRSIQQIGVDCDETFSPVVKPATIRTVLSLAASRHWHVHQLDVKNSFLHEVFIIDLKAGSSGPSFQDCNFIDLLLKEIMFDKHSSTTLLQRIISSLHQELSMTDLGPLNYFLGISVSRDDRSMFLHQRQYALEVLKRAGMLNCHPCRTPVDTEHKLGADCVSFSDPTLYKSLAGSLQYLTFTRPNLSYAVQQICLYMHDPHEPHLAALKRILRYVRGTLDYGLQLYFSSSGSLVGYIDANWAGCPTTHRSTFGYCIFLGNNLLSWSSKRQVTLSRSSAECESIAGVCNEVDELLGLRNLFAFPGNITTQEESWERDEAR
ncbi:ribonuclease H-like domain-containing protein [Tanacetum coccineum]